MTDAKRKSFIIGALRTGSRKWPPRYETLNASKTEKKVNKASGRIAQHYRCVSCSEEFPASQVQVDHIEPVIDPAVGFVSWEVFIDRLFCAHDNLQVLCKPCHNTKTNQERVYASKQVSRNYKRNGKV